MGVIQLLGIRGLIGLGVAVVLSVLLGLQVHKTHVEHASAIQWEQKYTGEHSALLQTIINYGRAAETARQEDAQNLQRVELKNADIGRQREASYEKRIADARALAERLQREADGARADPGGRAAATVPGVPAAPGGAPSAAQKDQLSRDDQLTATEQAIQLDEIIKWVLGVHAVPVNGRP